MNASIHLLLALLTTIQAQRTFLDIFTYKGRAFQMFLDQIADQQINTIQWQKAVSRKTQDVFNESTLFPCETKHFRSSERPRSVHMLKPGDIDVIGAMGDSLTAGYAALSTSLIDVMRNYRGVSFTIGGEKTWRQYLTLPNILKVFNPNLVGYSLHSSNTFDRASQFNVAENGGMTVDLTYMTKILLKRIFNDRRVDIQQDWKMITIFMGSNDFCNVCHESNPENILRRHKENLVAVLRLLRDNLPRTFVNIVNPPFVNLIGEIGTTNGASPTCFFSQRIACSCIVGEAYKHLQPRVVEIIRKWQKVEEEVAGYEEFDREDFTVVNQPLLQEPMLPRKPNGEVDLNYFGADCFHFSQKGHSLLAESLWNDILSPVGRKPKTITSTGFKCPTNENPYLFTRRNSNSVMIT